MEQQDTTQNNENNTLKLNPFLNTIKVVFELLLVIGFIVFEEIIWEGIVIKIYNKIVKLGFFQELQKWIELQNTYTTLVIFVVPFIFAELMSLYSGTLIVTGNILLGVILYIVKLPVAGVTFWIFSFSKVKLLSIDWFNTLYELLIRFFNWVKSTKIYTKVKDRINEVKEYIKNLKGEGNGVGSRFTKIYKDLKELFKQKDQ